MSAQKLFEPILDHDEKIIESFKPRKFRFVWIPFFFIFPLLLIILIPFIIFSVVEQDPEILYVMLGYIGFIMLCSFITPIVMSIRYEKTFYCYTNKRILIRTGFIGVDYKAIDFDLIGAMNVRVDFLDKLVKPNTGSIAFASAASPMISTGQSGVNSGYAFKCISNPYAVYKRIKEFSSRNKDGNLNS